MSDAPLIEITLRDVEVISKSSDADELHLLDIRGSVLGFRPSTLSFAIFIALQKSVAPRLLPKLNSPPAFPSSIDTTPMQLVSWVPRALAKRQF